ncbi:WD40/YVTN/BNR-like repeat-containing protein [Microvirga calopogonii]|uniref:WD40/YVTN/BNR-like repeat-containing protein n=1 Tax=Microvirga calopogonii TaxID=2078013 RepID=UPI0013B36617|nr:tectonin domain-containing protein [Microvirga calopogonii]
MQDTAHKALRQPVHEALHDLLEPYRPVSPPWVMDQQKFLPNEEYKWQRVPVGAHNPFPKVTDVAVNSMFNPALNVLLTGEDGHLWVANLYVPETIQSLGGNGFRRVAVGQNGKNVKCLDMSGILWALGASGNWIQTQSQIVGPLDDVMVDGNDVWLTGTNGTIWTTKDGTNYQDGTVLIGFQRLAVGADGSIWGIGTSGLLCWYERSTRTWYPSNGSGMEDLSVSYEGVIWLVSKTGQVWTTTDGKTFNPTPGTDFRRIAVGRYGIAYGVKTDGSLWMWAPAPGAPPPTGGGSGGGAGGTGGGSGGGSGTGGGSTTTKKPTITCTTTPPDNFKITGSDFLPNAKVNLRGANIINNQVNNVFWSTQSNSTGGIDYTLQIPCVPGVQISFSANDGRSDPNDLTGTLWSNTVTSSCPA